jgi:hypothetical protein
MTQNPYSPPAANLTPAITQPLSPCPISAWLLLIAMTLFGIAVLAQSFLSVVPRFSQSQQLDQWGVMLAIGVRFLVVIGPFLAVVIGIFKRKQWGRWLGLLFPAGLAALCIFGQDPTIYHNEAEQFGGFLGRRILMPLLLLWWAYAFGFSAKARRYFASGRLT